MKVFAYMRFSSDAQIGNTSVETQREAIRRFAESLPDLRGLPLVEKIDEAATGTTFTGREAFAEIGREASRGDSLLIYKYDRLGRSLLESLQQLDRLEREQGVRVFSATEPNSEVTRNLLLTMAQEYSRQLSDRVKRALDTLAATGHVPNHWPFGYRTERPSGPNARATLVVVPEQAVVVRRIFQLRAQGYSHRDIAKVLNAEKVPNASDGLWTVSSIFSMCKNETYLGRTISGRKVFKKGKGLIGTRPRSEWSICENAHEAIVTPELWAAVRSRDSRLRVGHKCKPQSRHLHTWTGFLVCAHCGANLIRQRSKHYDYYGCDGARKFGTKTCKSSRCLVRADEIDALVLPVLRQRIEAFQQEWMPKLVAIVRQEIEKGLASVSGAIKPMSAALRRLESQITGAEKRLLLVPEASFKACLEQLKELQAERDTIKAKIEAAEAKTGGPVNLDGLEDKLRKHLDGLWTGFEGKESALMRAVLAKHIEKITVSSDKRALLYPKPDGLLAGMASADPVWGQLVAGMGVKRLPSLAPIRFSFPVRARQRRASA